MKLLKTKVFMIFVLIPVFVLMVSAQRQLLKRKSLPVRTLVKAELISPANHYREFCPVTVKMTGKITVSKAMTVKYYFKRSDGVTTRLTPLIFTVPGTKNVPFSWKLGKDGQACVQLIVKTASGEVKSLQKEFDVKCDRKVIKKLTAAQIKKLYKPIQIGRARIIGPKAVLKQAEDILKVAPVVSDLVIKSINIQPDPGKTYEEITFSVIVKNVSNIRMEHSPSCYLKVVLSFNAGLFSPVNYVSDPYFYVIPEIGSMGERTIEFKLKLPCAIRWKIVAWADGKDTVKEFDENNNHKHETVEIIN